MSKASGRRVVRQAPRRSRAWVWIVLGVVVALVAVLAAILWPRPPAPVTLGAVHTYSGLSRTHTEGSLTYGQSPPVGGAHSAVWQNCGAYDQPVRNENAVHSLEHGAVWITYRPDLPAADVAALRAFASGQTHVLVSPYPGLSTPVAATAWGAQLFIDNARDPKLADFVRTYQEGQQTPEPGAPCSGGTGTPL